MKRYTDLTPEQQSQAVQYQLNMMDPELVATNPSQAQTIANRRARNVFYSEIGDIVLPLSVIVPGPTPTVSGGPV